MSNNRICHSQRLSQVNLIAGISSQNQYYFTLNKGKTNSLTFSYFLLKLVNHLDKEDRNWRQKTILMIDNAPYHRSKTFAQFIKDFQLPIMQLGPYQYKMAPVEMFFAFLKNKDLNPLQIRAYSKACLQTYLKELSLQIRTMNLEWLQKSFRHNLTAALQFLSLQNI